MLQIIQLNPIGKVFSRLSCCDTRLKRFAFGKDEGMKALSVRAVQSKFGSGSSLQVVKPSDMCEFTVTGMREFHEFTLTWLSFPSRKQISSEPPVIR